MKAPPKPKPELTLGLYVILLLLSRKYAIFRRQSDLLIFINIFFTCYVFGVFEEYNIPTQCYSVSAVLET